MGDAHDPLAEVMAGLDDADVGVRVRAVAVGVERRVPGLVKVLRERAPLQTDPVVRTACVTALVRLGEDALLREVARALRHKDAAVVVGAARVLAQIGDARAVPNLIEAFKTEDVVVGSAVARALGALGDVVVVPWLLAALDQDFCVDACCSALGQLKDERARTALEAAATSSEARVKLAAAQALHALDEAAHVDDDDANDDDDDGEA